MKPSEKLTINYNKVIELKNELGLLDLAIFGSCARNEDTEASDVDFIVVPNPDDIFSLYNFAARVKKILDCPVNVLSIAEGESFNSPVYASALRDRKEITDFSPYTN